MFINLRSLNCHIDIYGQGPPLLCLHGFTGAGENWRPFIDDWARFSRVITIDLIGHGRTDAPEDSRRYTMEEAVNDLRELLLKLNIERISILGYSMGGRLALAFAAAFPEMVEKLILESSSPGLKDSRDREERKKSDSSLARLIRQEGVSKFVERWENIPLFSSQEALSEEIKSRMRKQRRNNSPIGLANSLLGMGTGVQKPYWEVLEKLNFPVLLLCGEYDQKFCDIAVGMQKLLPQGALLKIKEAGHAIHVEKPQIFGKIVEKFLVSNDKKEEATYGN
ncbi:2-succinyl-6-hydroxy-2,4-cyclohexadiene-1-carboxylate synthase [Bacillus lacus]|uniref:Putative 2-succinyl-6-hydroxy-2,4-cyclohexadiene-1-carboxylate synthase n=1 Tax=Metabacillus lacus TaxID=1983721 RepID=A0A7X2IZF9_9BACI|nr:2-succinyl-6-hydroxy-2,4-cyclohexadiene-1-carboxylate synthase [Metabacillus lacus]MRX72429.1 2-succinyl-6-hydroxy-2,4-cyclohexadiene-1-carboxylate synthase [Metabacillus lacus]